MVNGDGRQRLGADRQIHVVEHLVGGESLQRHSIQVDIPQRLHIGPVGANDDFIDGLFAIGGSNDNAGGSIQASVLHGNGLVGVARDVCNLRQFGCAKRQVHIVSQYLGLEIGDIAAHLQVGEIGVRGSLQLKVQFIHLRHGVAGCGNGNLILSAVNLRGLGMDDCLCSCGVVRHGFHGRHSSSADR